MQHYIAMLHYTILFIFCDRLFYAPHSMLYYAFSATLLFYGALCYSVPRCAIICHLMLCYINKFQRYCHYNKMLFSI